MKETDFRPLTWAPPGQQYVALISNYKGEGQTLSQQGVEIQGPQQGAGYASAYYSNAFLSMLSIFHVHKKANDTMEYTCSNRIK